MCVFKYKCINLSIKHFLGYPRKFIFENVFSLQLFETTTPVVLYVTPPNTRNSDEGEQDLPAIMFQAEMQTKVNENAVIFKV